MNNTYTNQTEQIEEKVLQGLLLLPLYATNYLISKLISIPLLSIGNRWIGVVWGIGGVELKRMAHNGFCPLLFLRNTPCQLKTIGVL
jgi:hypothetical protein